MRVGRKIFITIFILITLFAAGLILYQQGIISDSYFSKPKSYAITFQVDDRTVGTSYYTVESESVNEPSIPEKVGYEAKWEEYSLADGGDRIVKAVYTPINYKLTFIASNVVQAEYTYNVEGTTSMTSEPVVPNLLGCKGEWEEYTLQGQTGDIRVAALYSSIDATEGLTYTFNEQLSAFEVTGYEGDSARVIIPEYYHNYHVVGVLAEAFKDNNRVVEVTLPKTLVHIDTDAFYDCGKLKVVKNFSRLGITKGENSYGGIAMNAEYVVTDEYAEDKLYIYDNFYFLNVGGEEYLMGYCGENTEIVLPTLLSSSYYHISDYAFYGEKELTQITFPTTVHTIGAYAFGDCSNLVAVKMNNFSTIDYTALIGCKNLENISISGGNVSRYSVLSGCLYDTSYGVIIKATKTASVLANSSVTTIADYAFEGNTMTTLVMPSNITKVGFGAFAGCNQLSELTVDFVGESATSSHAYLGYIFGAASNGENAQYVPTSLKKVTVTGSSYVKPYAFYNCSALEEIAVTNPYSQVQVSAFSGCNGLKKVNVSKVTNYFSSLFDGVIPTNLEEVELTATTSIGRGFFNGLSAAKKISISEGATVSSSAFSACNALETLQLPSLSSTLSSLFYDGVPSTLKSVTVLTGNSISSYAFDGVNSLQEVILPDTVTTIGTYAFHNCTALNRFHLPADLNTIGEGVFYNCTSLTSLTGGTKDTLTKIGLNAFNGTKLLTLDNGGYYVSLFGNSRYVLTSIVSGTRSFTVNNTTEMIADGAANNVITTLNQITISSSVKHICSSAFSGCSKLFEVYDFSNYVTLLVGSPSNGYVAQYAKVVHTTNAESYLYEQDGLLFVKNGDAYVLYGYTGSATELNLDLVNGKTYTIANDTFEYNNTLKKLTVTGGVTQIGRYAFAYSALETVRIDVTSITIGSYAFYYCSDLKEVYIKGASTIESNTFRYCSSLSNVTLAETVSQVNGNAFYNCNGLKQLLILNEDCYFSSSAFNNTLYNLKVLYKGVESGKTTITNSCYRLGYATWYYYQEYREGVTTPGNYWNYGEGNIPVEWVVSEPVA